MKQTNKKGFTMVEILITVAIIAVLAGIAVPIVTHYMNEGRDDYNEKLKEQLLVAGKEYFADNKQKLPVLDYTGVYRDGKDFSYVSLLEMQSNNYISKEFVDSEGNKCSESYVYVRQEEQGYDWHACLKCTTKEGKVINYSEKDAACDITDWEDDKIPTCNPTPNYVGGKDGNLTNTKYNPTSIKLKDISDFKTDSIKGNIANIIVQNETTEEEIIIKAKKTDEETMNINIMDYINNKYFETKDGKYKIIIQDRGGHRSDSCASFIIKSTKPTCELKVPENPKTKEDKKITITVKDGISTEEELNYAITDIENYQIKKSDKIKVYSLTGKKDGRYYGYVQDEIGQTSKCYKDVKITMFKDENAYCSFYTKNDGTWYGGSIKTKIEPVECYVYGGNNATINKNMIKTTKGLGTIAVKISNKKNNNTNNKVIYDISYTPKPNVSGYDNIVLEKEFFSSLDANKSNNKVISQNIKIDTIAPKIELTNPKNGVWTNNNVTITGNATDNGGGIASIEYSADKKTWKKIQSNINNPSKTYSQTLTNTQTYYARSIDVAGNVSAVKSTSIKIDKIKPKISFSRSGRSVTITCTDSGGSGLKSPVKTTKTLKAGKNIKVTGTCKDKAGNSISKTNTYTVNDGGNFPIRQKYFSQKDLNKIFKAAPSTKTHKRLYPWECVTYAKLRAVEILLTDTSISDSYRKKAIKAIDKTHGNGGTWYAPTNPGLKKFNYDRTCKKPKAGSLISWKSSSVGHVGIIESVEGNNVIITDGYRTSHFNIYRKVPISKLSTLNGIYQKCYGITYLFEYKG